MIKQKGTTFKKSNVILKKVVPINLFCFLRLFFYSSLSDMASISAVDWRSPIFMSSSA